MPHRDPDDDAECLSIERGMHRKAYRRPRPARLDRDAILRAMLLRLQAGQIEAAERMNRLRAAKPSRRVQESSPYVSWML
jgi:hypothetical protein